MPICLTAHIVALLAAALGAYAQPQLPVDSPALEPQHPGKASTSQQCVGGRVRPKLFIIGCQKGGTSSLFAELVGATQGAVAGYACRWTKTDAKECNAFSSHTTLSNMYLEYGESFCRPGSITDNYCRRLKARRYQPSHFFHGQYDECAPDDHPGGLGPGPCMATGYAVLDNLTTHQQAAVERPGCTVTLSSRATLSCCASVAV